LIKLTLIIGTKATVSAKALGDNSKTLESKEVDQDDFSDDDESETIAVDSGEVPVTVNDSTEIEDVPSTPCPIASGTKHCGKKVTSIKLRPVLDWLTHAPTEKVTSLSTPTEFLL